MFSVSMESQRQAKSAKVDVISNEALVHCSVLGSIGVLASEENEEPMLVHKGSNEAKYAMVFDPLDGSSNIA